MIAANEIQTNAAQAFAGYEGLRIGALGFHQRGRYGRMSHLTVLPASRKDCR